MGTGRSRRVRAARPRSRRSLPNRDVLCGILYVLHTGIQWEHLPHDLGFSSGMTCWRRLRDWNEAGGVAAAAQSPADRTDFGPDAGTEHSVVVDEDHAHVRGRHTGPSPVDRSRAGHQTSMTHSKAQ